MGTRMGPQHYHGRHIGLPEGTPTRPGARDTGWLGLPGFGLTAVGCGDTITGRLVGLGLLSGLAGGVYTRGTVTVMGTIPVGVEVGVTAGVIGAAGCGAEILSI